MTILTKIQLTLLLTIGVLFLLTSAFHDARKKYKEDKHWETLFENSFIALAVFSVLLLATIYMRIWL